MVFVLSQDQQPLDPCHGARARQLLKHGKAAVFRSFPFTIILKHRSAAESQTHEHRLKFDPGSKTTGIAVVRDSDGTVVWAGELSHRGQAIRDALERRRAVRRSRRQRKTRYRQARFLNRCRPQGWLAPSLQHRVATTLTWAKRLLRLLPCASISTELVRFDTQLLQDAEISGVAYQQGELAGYELREYLLDKWQRRCAYCGAAGVALQVEHIVPRSRGGSDRVSYLTLACKPCNERKGNQTAAEFGFPHIQAQARQPLKDAAAVTSTRWALYQALLALGLPLEAGTGGRTKRLCNEKGGCGFPRQLMQAGEAAHCYGDTMAQVTNLIRSYTNQPAYEQDAVHLARLGYVVATVVEVPAPPYWVGLLGRLFGVEPRRLTVTYRDAGVASR